MANPSTPAETPEVNVSEVVRGSELRNDVPRTNILSNGRLTSVVFSTGASRISYDGIALNRWRRDHAHSGGSYRLYLRDLDSGEVWNPLDVSGDDARLMLDPGRVVAERIHAGIRSTVEIFVASEQDLEVRRITLHTSEEESRQIEVISYMELALGPQDADVAHPSFSKLFVQTAIDADQGTIRAWRRQRSPEEQDAFLFHASRGDGRVTGFETSRAEFVGRGRDLDRPRAVETHQKATGSDGSVLDPIASIRRAVEVSAGESISITFFAGAGRERKDVDDLVGTLGRFEVGAEMTAASAREVQLMLQSKIDSRQARYFRRLGAALFVDDPRLRAPVELAERVDAPVSRLEDLGIDRALPLIVVRVSGEEDIPLQRTLMKAHNYWRQQGLSVNLFVLNDISEVEAAERLQASIEQAAAAVQAPVHLRGGVFMEYADDMHPEDQVLLQSHASILIREEFPDLAEGPPSMEISKAYAPLHRAADGGPRFDTSSLRFANGYGGFSEDGREYVIDVSYHPQEGHKLPPHPWVNVIANPEFGFLISETGGGYSWSQNSRENRLTPWTNDAVVDAAGEFLFARDDDKGLFWNLMPGRMAAPVDYRVRHGLGYSVFEAVVDGIRHEVTTFVDAEKPTKVVRVELTNESGRKRAISIVGAHRLVMGNDEETSSRYLTASVDAGNVSAYMRNRTNGEFRNRSAFSSLKGPGKGHTHVQTWTEDLSQIASDVESRGKTRGDTVVHRRSVALQEGETATFAFLLGEEDGEREIEGLLDRFSDADAWEKSLSRARARWTDLTLALQVSTPSPEIDLMVNGWLTYQNLSCRIWGRSAFYQSGGAYGYRDQLQDSSALVLLLPQLSRRQILLHAEQQFPEGDVMHWWHPPTGKGIRTRFSDDLLWLPYITAYYVETTGDTSILDETTSFIQARELNPGEDEAFVYPDRMDRSATVYEHCCLAIDRSLTQGPNGLPLMGTGDWNDGMNRVGRGGKGESVWLGFFIATIIDHMLPICESRGDSARVESYRSYREHLQRTLNEAGWDGEWYRRAYYDNGDPIGSRDSDECKIDALAQAWAVMSGVAPPERAESALDALERELVDEDAGIIRLLTPAFDVTKNDPGYIKGYVPGVRENGGQYTHAALWAVRALAEAGRRERAANLLAMLSPISHSSSQEKADQYRVEPYVIAADVYGEAPHIGRGGWTWYTGSAGWMYRVAVESILGFRVIQGKWIELDPVIPRDWPGYSIRYRLPEEATTYEIDVVQNERLSEVTLDGAKIDRTEGKIRIPIERDGALHRVRVALD